MIFSLPEPRDNFLGPEIAESARRIASVRSRMEEDGLTAEVIRVLEGKGYVVTPPERDDAHRGWFADLDEERGEVAGYAWRPFLQCPGHVVPADIWFASEEDCQEFIRTDILGRGMTP